MLMKIINKYICCNDFCIDNEIPDQRRIIQRYLHNFMSSGMTTIFVMPEISVDHANIRHSEEANLLMQPGLFVV
jgi:hypothetical protein